jgi:ABC-type uncharacterized transport system involved in gliding motility auxiliary subunit
MVIAIVVVVNILGSRYVKSFDTTSSKRYSLSDQTLKVVGQLQQDATISYYDQTTRFQEARDLFNQYENASNRIRVQYSDPDKDPNAARQAGIAAYGTAIVQVGDKKETAKSITEEGITGALIRTLKDTVRTVCFVTGSGEHLIDDTQPNGYSTFKDVLAKDNYQTQSISLLQTPEVPAECTTVIIGGPSSNYLQIQVDVIEKYVEGGGRALFLVDPPVQVGRMVVAENERLTALLASWGVTLGQDIVLDMNPLGQLAGVGPQVALVTNYESHPIVNVMKGTATGFPMSRTLETSNSDKIVVEKLFSSSQGSLATSDLRSGAVRADDPRNKKGPFTLAAAGTYKTDKENSQGRFVVVGTSFWATNSFITFNGNSDFALNAINWLASDEDLISIRPREQDRRPINMTNSQLGRVRIWSQFVLPLAVVLMGISVWWRRR